MKNTIYSALFFLLFLPAIGVIHAAESEHKISGDLLAQQVYDRPNGNDASARIRMLLKSEGKEPRQRLLYSYTKDKGSAQRWTLLRFVEPKDVDASVQA